MSFDNPSQRSLGKTLTIDAFSALATSFMVAPFMTVIDKSIIRNANGSMPLL